MVNFPEMSMFMVFFNVGPKVGLAGSLTVGQKKVKEERLVYY